MTVYELMNALADVSKGNHDLDVEIHVKTRTRKIESELQEDAKTGEIITVELYFDEYCEDISVSDSEVGGNNKVCITADCG